MELLQGSVVDTKGHRSQYDPRSDPAAIPNSDISYDSNQIGHLVSQRIIAHQSVDSEPSWFLISSKQSQFRWIPSIWSEQQVTDVDRR